MQKIIATSHQEQQHDVVFVRSLGMPADEVLRTAQPLLARADARVEQRDLGISLKLHAGHAKEFLQGLAMLFGARGVQVHCAC